MFKLDPQPSRATEIASLMHYIIGSCSLQTHLPIRVSPFSAAASSAFGVRCAVRNKEEPWQLSIPRTSSLKLFATLTASGCITATRLSLYWLLVEQVISRSQPNMAHSTTSSVFDIYVSTLNAGSLLLFGIFARPLLLCRLQAHQFIQKKETRRI